MGPFPEKESFRSNKQALAKLDLKTSCLLKCSVISILKKVALHLNKFKCPSTKEDLCQFGLNWTIGSGLALRIMRKEG